jgi:integrase
MTSKKYDLENNTMKKKFDDLTVKDLKPESKTFFCMAEDETGFGIRVYPSGVKSFIFKYKVDGAQKIMTFGEYPSLSLKDARDEYLKAYLQVKDLRKGRADGADPVKEIKQKAERRIAEEAESKKNPTVTNLVTEYIDRHAKVKKRSWKKDEEMLNRDVVPVWGKRKAQDIVKRDVTLLMEGIIDRGAAIMANRVFSVIRKMFNYGIEKDIVLHNPCTGLKPPSDKQDRTRALTEKEIKALWESLNRSNLNISIGATGALKLILLTAQRPGEVTGMHTNEIDGAWWTIPAARAKNKRAHRVYLSGLAQEIITETIDHVKLMRKIPAASEYSGFIFPCPHKDKNRPLGNTALAVAVGRNLAYPLTDTKGNPLYQKDGKPATENRLGVDHFTPHDLRRSAATLLAAAKIKFEHRERVLSHTMGKLDGTYNQHDFDDEKQVALETLERRIKAIIAADDSAKVIPITRKAA